MGTLLFFIDRKEINMRTLPPNEEKYYRFVIPSTRKKFLSNNKKFAKRNRVKLRADVMNFIADMLYTTLADPVYVYILFTQGYCYHFACILEHEFGGSIWWVPTTSHIVWKDENGVPYDIEGYRYELEPDEMILIEELEVLNDPKDVHVGLEGYRHRFRDLLGKYL